MRKTSLDVPEDNPWTQIKLEGGGDANQEVSSNSLLHSKEANQDNNVMYIANEQAKSFYIYCQVHFEIKEKSCVAT